MPIIKKLAILIIFIIFSIILYRLMIERRSIKLQYGIEGFREGAWFSSPTIESELAAVKTTDVPASTMDTIEENNKLALKQFCIKGSYNSAITGKFVNTEMIKYVFYRGCRFLDFEIFSFDGEPYVAMSTDSTYASIDTTNKVPLQDILTTIYTHAFSAPSQIQKDPVFINLRIKTKNIELYDRIGDTIDYILKDRMYLDENGIAKKVTGDTILSDISEKIIIVIDKTLAPTYTFNSNLVNYVNMECGGSTMRLYSYSILQQQQYNSPNINDDLTTDVTSMKLVYPDLDSSIFGVSRNSIYYPMVLNYGVQVVLYPFYKADIYLGQYEKAFSEKKAGFVPMSQMIIYLRGTLGKNMLSESVLQSKQESVSRASPTPSVSAAPVKQTNVDIGKNLQNAVSNTSRFLFHPQG